MNVGIFKDMYDGRELVSERDYHELRRMLSEAVDRGHVEQIPVVKPTWSQEEIWFRDRETGEIYALAEPGERSCGHWGRVGLDEIPESTKLVQ